MERIITINGLSLMACVGVPDEELAAPQRLCFDLRFAALFQPAELNDDLSATVDYSKVSQRVEEIAHARARRLIETLADEIAAKLLEEFQLRWMEITLRKFILPNTEFVAVTVRRERTIYSPSLPMASTGQPSIASLQSASSSGVVG